MILTGKCKEDFGNQSELDYYDFIRLNETIQYAMIIEWFDSVGIYILPQLWENTMNWNYRISDRYVSDFEYKSRQEATKQSIIKANEIYNKTFR